MINLQLSLYGKKPGPANDITYEYEAFRPEDLFAPNSSYKIKDLENRVNKQYPTLYHSKPNAINVDLNKVNSREDYYGKIR